jgi:nucleoside-diphosphate-sugar epimerase
MSFWLQHRTLVLGAAGFCGAHLCQQLVARGASVLAVDKWLPPDSYLRRSGTLEQVHFETGDILDLPSLKLLLERFPVDTVFLLAAQPIVTISNQLPLETAHANIIGTYNVLEAIRGSRRPPRLLFASSGAYYGLTNTTEAIPEEAPPLVAGNIYAPTKAAADLAVRCYAKIYGLNTVTCRWMNTYGPGDTNFSRIVPSTMRRLASGERAHIDLTDGTNVLEMLHVRDMIEAYLRAAEHVEEDGVRGEAFNFGGGEPLTLLHVVREIARAWNSATGQELPIEPEITGPKVQSVKYLDISKARRLLGWEPQIPLFDGLLETAQWYRTHL